MSKMRQQRLIDQSERLEAFKGKNLNLTSADDKKLQALGLGASYLSDNPRQAITHLSSAEAAASPDDALLPVIRFFLAEAHFNAGSFTEAVKILEGMLNANFTDPWKRKAFDLLIDAYYQSQQLEQLAAAYSQYADRYGFGGRQEGRAVLAVTAFEKRGDMARAVDLLEELARHFPATEESRWAFRKLSDLSCAKPPYFFSDRLLIAVARNAVLDKSVSDMVVHLARGPVRMHPEKEGKVLGLEARAQLYYRMQRFVEAAEDSQQAYEEAKALGDHKRRAENNFVLARTYLRQKDLEKSATWFSRFLEDFPNHTLAPAAREHLGDTFKYLNFPKLAAQFYGEAIGKKKDKLLQWEHFWNSYRGRDYAKAKSLLDTPGYVQPRPGDEAHTLDYWHGRILERLGQKAAAREKFAKLLTSHGDSFYANVIAGRFPDLIGANNLASLAKGKTQGKGFSLAAKILAPDTSASLQQPELKAVDHLLKIGLRDAAALQLSGLRWADYNRAEAFTAVARLAWSLDDYQSSRRIRVPGRSSLAEMPESYREFLEHQASNPDDWKVYYPYAFERYLNPVAKSLGIDPLLMLSIMRSESFYNREAKSPVGAMGLMQLMPYTALKIAMLLHDADFRLADLARPEVNISYGGFYLARLLNYYKGNPYVAVAAYNAGPVAVNTWLEACSDCTTDEFVETIPYRETRRYVREVMRTLAHYQRVYIGRSDSQNLPALPSGLSFDEEIF